jgi:hypothetical protein
MTSQIIDFNKTLNNSLDKVAYCAAVLGALREIIPDLTLRKDLMLLRDREFEKYKGGIYKEFISRINEIAKSKEALFLS